MRMVREIEDMTPEEIRRMIAAAPELEVGDGGEYEPRSRTEEAVARALSKAREMEEWRWLVPEAREFLAMLDAASEP